MLAAREINDTIRKYFWLCLWFPTDIYSCLNILCSRYSRKQIFFLSNWSCRRMLKSQSFRQIMEHASNPSAQEAEPGRFPRVWRQWKLVKHFLGCAHLLCRMSIFSEPYFSESTFIKLWHTAQKTECRRQPLLWAGISVRLELGFNNKWKNRRDGFAYNDVLVFFKWVTPLYFF